MTNATSIPCALGDFAELSAEVLRAGKALRFQARGTSMMPLVRDGDVLLVRPVDAGDVSVGDLVLCHSEPDRLLVHRVIRRQESPDGRLFAVQGDQSTRPDGLLAGTQIYGKVTEIERAGVRMDMSGPALRLLGWLAALRSRWNAGRGWPSRLAVALLGRVPAFSRYLK